jgi:hypothetical protein
MFENRSGQMIRNGLYILAAILIAGLSVVLPLRTESSVFFFMIGVSAAAYIFAFLLYRMIRRILGSSMVFGYDPARSYLAGFKAKRSGKSVRHDSGTGPDSGKNG